MRTDVPAAESSTSDEPDALSFADESTATPRYPSPSHAPARTAGGALADAAREHEHVEASERGGHGADAGPQAVQVDVEGQPGRSIAVAGALDHDPHVSGARQPEQATCVLERLGELTLAHRLMLEQPQEHARIDAARTRGHHEPLKRGEAHGRVDRRPVADRAQRGAGAEMTTDDADVRATNQRRRPPRDPSV